MDFPNWQEFLELTDHKKREKKKHYFTEEQLQRAFFGGLWEQQEIRPEARAEIKKEFKKNFFERNLNLFLIFLVVLTVIFIIALVLFGGLETIEGLISGG